MANTNAYRKPSPIWRPMALGRSFFGCGSSSAMCVIASGVPIVKAPLRTPSRNATPSCHPVMLFSVKDPQTNWLLACCFGMAAMTMMVTIPPTMTKNMPAVCVWGMTRLTNTTIVTQNHVIRT